MDAHLELLKEYKFEKQIEKLKKKLKNKTVVIYGAGEFFDKIKNNYDISFINIIGVSDKKYNNDQEGQEDKGYKIIPCDKIAQYKPDYVVVSTLFTYKIIKSLKNDLLKETKIKIIPLVKKNLFDRLYEMCI